MFCDACRSTMHERDKYCAACGAPALQKRCDKCGKSNRSESIFCVYCGDSLRTTINAGHSAAEDIQACFAFAADRDRRLNVVPHEVAL